MSNLSSVVVDPNDEPINELFEAKRRIKELEDKYKQLLFDSLEYLQNYSMLDPLTDSFEHHIQQELKVLEEK